MNLEYEILTALLEMGERPVTTHLVHSQVRLSTGSDKTLTDVKQALGVLSQRGEVKGVSSRDHGQRWAISDQGKLRLAE